jgi:hypothetical protein
MAKKTVKKKKRKKAPARPAVKQTKPVADKQIVPPAVKARTTVCRCGGGEPDAKVRHCEACGNIWCDFCLRGHETCPVCS